MALVIQAFSPYFPFFFLAAASPASWLYTLPDLFVKSPGEKNWEFPYLLYQRKRKNYRARPVTEWQLTESQISEVL